ncbi:MAG: hypothetical protein HYV09_40635, partial [Deltaproteobacteria bacterium]|nr:hypothetical protein [Deltaproteobacteria bacterium]
MSIRRITFASFVLASIATSACSGPAKDEPAACADCAETGGDTGSLFPGFDSDSGAGSTPTTDAAIDDAAIDTAPSCVPADGADDPDDDFKDTNCDGIDGDKSRAIFVAPDGKDDAAGTLDAPVHSFAKAIERANELGKDVYACNGTYAENVVIAKAVRVFGGFDCKAGWKRTLDRARIAPSKGIPLTVNTVATDGVQLDRIALRAPDGVDAGESSIALFANQSKVVVTNGEIEAGSGADGLSPASPASITTPATKGRDAANGTPRECSENLSSMPWTMVYLCTTPELGPQTTTPVPTCEGRGGKGGNGGVGRPEWANAKPPTGGTAGLPAPSPGGPSRTSIGRGLDGAQGAVGASGVSSKVAFGTVTEKGYVADNSGTAGGPGATGGGGSGGWGNVGAAVWAGSFVAYYYNGGAGGEGGFGGCGGAGGEGGGGGGASVGVLSFK